jgi:hypothetical protein
VGAPKGTPAEVIERLNQVITAGITESRRGSSKFRGTPFALLPADFSKLIIDETKKWGKVMGNEYQTCLNHVLSS